MKKTLVLLILASNCFSSVLKRGDFQLWNAMHTTFQLKDHLGLKLEGEVRTGNDVSEVFFVYGQASIEYKPVKWFLLGGGYRHQWIFLDSKWFNVYSPLLDVKGIWIIDHFGITNRNRVQYLIIENDKHRWLYRNRLRFSYQIDSWKMRPFIDDEVFFLQGGGFVQNRATAGIIFLLDDWINLDLFYMLRHLSVDSHFRHQNVFGLYLNFFF